MEHSHSQESSSKPHVSVRDRERLQSVNKDYREVLKDEENAEKTKW